MNATANVAWDAIRLDLYRLFPVKWMGALERTARARSDSLAASRADALCAARAPCMGAEGRAVQDAAREIVLEKLEFVGDLRAAGDASAAERHLKDADQDVEDDVDRNSLRASVRACVRACVYLRACVWVRARA